MPILDFKNKAEVDEYKKFVDTYNTASIMQIIEWKHLKEDWKQENVYIKDNDGIIAGM